MIADSQTNPWAQRSRRATTSPFPNPNSPPFIRHNSLPNLSLDACEYSPFSSSHHRTRNRNAAALVPVALNALCLPGRAPLWLDDGADC
jgi:hypothetical protein